VMASDYYCLPSLLELALQALCRPALLPPTQDLLPLPTHLKDGLRRRLCKRGRLTGGQLAALVHPGVREVDLSDCSLTGGHLTSLQPCPRLARLNLNQPRHPDKRAGRKAEPLPHHLSSLLSTCRHLSVLHLRDCRTCVTDQVAALLPATLVHLDLGGCHQLGDPGVAQVAANCARLQSLSLARTGVSDLGLSGLGVARCRDSLQEVKVDGCRLLTDLGVELLLDGLARLQILSFHSCPGLTERSREVLQEYLGQGGVRQLTWTVY